MRDESPLYQAIMALIAEERRKELLLSPLRRCKYCASQHRCESCPNCGAPSSAQILTNYGYNYAY